MGGLPVLGANTDASQHGVFTKPSGTLTNDFFVNHLDIGTVWKATSEAEDTFEARDRATGEPKWTGTRVEMNRLASRRAEVADIAAFLLDRSRPFGKP